MAWQVDPNFDAAEELLKQASLKELYEMALERGVATVAVAR